MVEPLSIQEQIEQACFVPDHLLLVLFCQSKFDAVEKDNSKGQSKQAMIDVSQAL